jgi:hypothetical protein
MKAAGLRFLMVIMALARSSAFYSKLWQPVQLQSSQVRPNLKQSQYIFKHLLSLQLQGFRPLSTRLTLEGVVQVPTPTTSYPWCSPSFSNSRTISPIAPSLGRTDFPSFSPLLPPPLHPSSSELELPGELWYLLVRNLLKSKVMFSNSLATFNVESFFGVSLGV